MTGAPCGQVRVLLYLGALCSGILETLADVEREAVGALACPGRDRWLPRAGLGSLVGRGMYARRHAAARHHAHQHKRRVQRALHDMLNRASVRSAEGERFSSCVSSCTQQ